MFPATLVFSKVKEATSRKNQTCSWGTDGTSATAFGDSEVDFIVALADSDNAGQETAPMTGLPSEAAPLDGLFQAGLLPILPLGKLPLSKLSPTELESSTGKDGEVTVEDSTTIAADGGDEGEAAVGSDSPRTIWVHGDETADLIARRD